MYKLHADPNAIQNSLYSFPCRVASYNLRRADCSCAASTASGLFYQPRPVHGPRVVVTRESDTEAPCTRLYGRNGMAPAIRCALSAGHLKCRLQVGTAVCPRQRSSCGSLHAPAPPPFSKMATALDRHMCVQLLKKHQRPAHFAPKLKCLRCCSSHSSIFRPNIDVCKFRSWLRSHSG